MIERRAVSRKRVYCGGLIRIDRTRGARCTVRDVSPRGVRIALSTPVPLSDATTLTIWHHGRQYAATTVWRHDNDAGLALDFSGSQRAHGGVWCGFLHDTTAAAFPTAFVLTAAIGGIVAFFSAKGVGEVTAAKLDDVITALKRLR